MSSDSYALQEGDIADLHHKGTNKYYKARIIRQASTKECEDFDILYVGYEDD